MTWTLLQLLTVGYFVGLLLFQRRSWRLPYYLWGAVGFTFLVVHLSLLMGWNVSLARVEAMHARQIMALFGQELQFVGESTLLVRDPTGWTGLNIGIECSTLMEISVFGGLLLYYPRFALPRRAAYLIVGILGTYVLNLLRIILIVVMVSIFGKSIVPVTHAVIVRALYFFGVVALYWYLLTKPTLTIVRRSIEVTGLGVD